MVKESSLSILWWQDKQSIATVVLTCTKSKARMKSLQSSSKIQTKIFPGSCCSKMLKWGLLDFTCTYFMNVKKQL